MIGPEGEVFGVLPTFEAVKKARELGLDLVEIAPTAQPPVCKIQDFGKFLYEQGKKEKAAKKSQKVITIKEVKFSINVDEHDFTTKRNHVLRFLEEGDKVKASLRFKGREMAHRDLGRKVIERVIREVGEKGMVEMMPRMEGNTMHAILTPRKDMPKPAKAKPAPSSPAGQASA